MTGKELWIFYQELRAKQEGYFIPVDEVEV